MLGLFKLLNNFFREFSKARNNLFKNTTKNNKGIESFFCIVDAIKVSNVLALRVPIGKDLP